MSTEGTLIQYWMASAFVGFVLAGKTAELHNPTGAFCFLALILVLADCAEKWTTYDE